MFRNFFKNIFDYDDGDFIHSTGGNTGIDDEGHMHMRMGDNMSMDMDSGDIHFTSGWPDDNDTFNNSFNDDFNNPW